MVAGGAHAMNNPLAFSGNNVAVLQRDVKAVLDLLRLYQQADPLLAEQRPDLTAEIRDLSERVDLAYTIKNGEKLLPRSRDGLGRIQQIVKAPPPFARLDESDLHE